MDALTILVIPVSVAIVELAKRMNWICSARAILLTNLIVMACLYGIVQYIALNPIIEPYVKMVFDVLVYALAASGLYSSNRALKESPELNDPGRPE